MENYNQAIYEATGYKVVPNPSSSSIVPDLVYAFVKSFAQQELKQQKQNANMLAKYVRDYPTYSEAYYVLGLFYARNKQPQHLQTLQEQWTKNFLNDLRFSLILAEVAIREGKFAEARKILGEDLTLKSAFPERAFFVEKEYVQYHAMLTFYHMKNKKDGKAHKILHHFLQVYGDNKATQKIADIICAVQSSRSMTENLLRFQLKGKEAECKPRPVLPPMEEMPAYHHPREMGLLREYATNNLPVDIIQQIIDLPKETLREDLENCIRRTAYLITKLLIQDNSAPAEDEGTEAFYEHLHHSLMFLAMIDAKESLPIVLDVLRYGNEFIEYCFGYTFEHIQETVYILGESQLPTLVSFAKESYVDSFGKEIVLKVLEQVGLHQPERQTEVIAHLEDLAKEYLARQHEDAFADSITASMLIDMISTFKAKQLLPLSKELADAGLYLESMMGDWDMVELRFEGEIHEKLIDLPKTIFEFYDQSYKKPYEFEETLEVHHYMAKKFQQEIFGEEEEEEEMPRLEDLKKQLHEVVYQSEQRSVTKVSPNEPCPCGSGKKYKKCCRNK